MKSENKDVNEVCLMGRCVTDFRFSYSFNGTNYYTFDFISVRDSGVQDRIPVMVSEAQCNVISRYKDGYMCIKGQFRSIDRKEQGRNRLILSVYAEDVDCFLVAKEHIEKNYIYLEGYVCKETVYRRTPAGRKITDIMMAVERPYKGVDFLPCISWGKYAQRAAGFFVGERIWLRGRIQSRNYIKESGEGKKEIRIAYEVSAFEIGRVGTENRTASCLEL